MPVLQQKIVHKNCQVAIWHLTESKDELIKMAEQLELEYSFPEIKNENRLRQRIATRLLLHQLQPKAKITYNTLGKPLLNIDYNISISHTTEYVAILLNNKTNCGIDVEEITPKVARIKHKFLNSDDLKKIESIEELTIYWSAKEALYKFYGLKELLFIEHLFIEDFSKQQSTFTGKVITDNHYTELTLHWEKIGYSILVYTL